MTKQERVTETDKNGVVSLCIYRCHVHVGENIPKNIAWEERNKTNSVKRHSYHCKLQVLSRNEKHSDFTNTQCDFEFNRLSKENPNETPREVWGHGGSIYFDFWCYMQICMSVLVAVLLNHALIFPQTWSLVHSSETSIRNINERRKDKGIPRVRRNGTCRHIRPLSVLCYLNLLCLWLWRLCISHKYEQDLRLTAPWQPTTTAISAGRAVLNLQTNSQVETGTYLYRLEHQLSSNCRSWYAVASYIRPVAWFLNGGVRFNLSNFLAKKIWERQRREFLGGSGGMLPREIFEKLALWDAISCILIGLLSGEFGRFQRSF